MKKESPEKESPEREAPEKEALDKEALDKEVFAKESLRAIRSFVRREGRMGVRQKRAIENLWHQYVVPTFPLFLKDSSQPCVLEIGFGRGTSLLEMAKNNPDQYFLGIEVYRLGVGNLLANLEEQGISNVRIICDDAVDVLEKRLPDASFDKVQLFFPDPWPKKRHHKRRLVQPPFVEKIADKLKPGGIFHLATDWQPYAEYMLAVISASSHFLNQAGPQKFAERPDYRPLTPYERRGKALGHGVWDLIFMKIL